MSKWLRISAVFLFCARLDAAPTNLPTHMYWIETLPSFTDFALNSSDLQGENVTGLTVLDPLPTDLAIDFLHNKLYWVVDAQMIQRANLDGSGIETIINDSSDAIGPHSIALDSQRGKIYWTDVADSVIRRANLDGTAMEDVVQTDRFPEDLKLDLVNDKVYWLDLDTSVNPPHGIWGIRRANLDGSNMMSIVHQFGPSNFAIDPARNALYWSQYVNDHNYRSTLDGQLPQVLYDGSAGIRGPWEMDVNPQDGKLYWVELISGAIRRSGPFGGSMETLYVGGPIRSFAMGPIPEPSSTTTFASAIIPLMLFGARNWPAWRANAETSSWKKHGKTSSISMTES